MENRFDPEGFLKFSEVVNQASARLKKNTEENLIYLTCGYLSLKIPRKDLNDFVVLQLIQYMRGE